MPLRTLPGEHNGSGSRERGHRAHQRQPAAHGGALAGTKQPRDAAPHLAADDPPSDPVGDVADHCLALVHGPKSNHPTTERVPNYHKLVMAGRAPLPDPLLVNDQ